MSNLSPQSDEQSDCQAGTCDGIDVVITPKERDIGDFSVRRLLPAAQMRKVGPWIFFDHMGPAQFPAGRGINVRPHPHIHLATVTYLFEGEILHRDSLGSEQLIRPGDVNLMVAGTGIVHSERERPEVTHSPHTLHGLQLWLALPEHQQNTAPAFYHYPGQAIPAINIEGVSVRVIMGSAYGAISPVKTFAQTLYVEAHLKKGQSLSVPHADEKAVYVASGKIAAGNTEVSSYNMAVFAPVEGIAITAIEDARVAIIGGENITHRHMFWNFASTDKAYIEKAKRDWQERRFPAIPGDDDEFIPLP